MHRLESFACNGFAGPFRIGLQTEITALIDTLKSTIFHTTPPFSGHPLYARHLDSPLVFSLCSHPAIMAVIRAILGNNILLWNSSFILKEPNHVEIPWHQDLHYWPLEPAITLSAWIALTNTSPLDGCLQVIPRTHMLTLPYTIMDHESGLDKVIDTRLLTGINPVSLPVVAGQFVIFNERLVHRSFPNYSSKTRVSLVARFTLPSVCLNQDRLPFFPGHGAILVSGNDQSKINILSDPP